MNKKGDLLESLHTLMVFAFGTMMFIAIGYLMILWFSSSGGSALTGYSTLGVTCKEANCGDVQDWILIVVALSIVFNIVFYYAFYKKNKK